MPGSRIQKLNKSELSEESQHPKGPKTVPYSSSCTSKNDIPLLELAPTWTRLSLTRTRLAQKWQKVSIWSVWRAYRGNQTGHEKDGENWERPNGGQREETRAAEDSGISVYMRCMLAYQRISDLRNLRILICNLNNFPGRAELGQLGLPACFTWTTRWWLRRIVFFSATHVDKATRCQSGDYAPREHADT